MAVIKAKGLTKDYGQGRGVFGISFEVNKGEVYGFLGPNGAGKTTTIRQLLGFSKPQAGGCTILDYNCLKNQKEIQKHIGYVPGEIAFPEHLTGYEFLEEIAALRKMTSLDRARELIEYFDLDPRGELKRMSKGMKQKIAIVNAFMHNPEIIILDEPTSGLDPLMQSKFVELIKSEKEKGNTIFMSSHMFEEVEKTCDRVAVIRSGKIVSEVLIKEIEHKNDKVFEIKLSNSADFNLLKKSAFNFIEINEEKARVKINIHDNKIGELLNALAPLQIEYISEIKYTLEQYFMEFYKKEESKNV